MPDEQVSPPALEKGTYHPPLPTDLRGPCPMINTLANHGYLPRDGRSIRHPELYAALAEAGLSAPLKTAFAYGTFLEYPSATNPNPPGFWSWLRAPVAYFLRPFGMRERGQVDGEGERVFDIDQLNRHAYEGYGATEHDVSLTRRDDAQGDDHSLDKELLGELLASSADGEVITLDDFAGLRRRRIETQREDNPRLKYTSLQHQIACIEVTLLEKLFGDKGRDWAVPVEYMRVFLGEERFPFAEGWRKRAWWACLGIVDMYRRSNVVKAKIGPVDLTTPS